MHFMTMFALEALLIRLRHVNIQKARLSIETQEMHILKMMYSNNITQQQSDQICDKTLNVADIAGRPKWCGMYATFLLKLSLLYLLKTINIVM